MATTRLVFRILASDDASLAFERLRRQVDKTNRSIDQQNTSMKRLSVGVGIAKTSMSGLQVAMVGLAPAALPGLAAAGAAVAGIAAAAAAGGAAFGVFGVTAYQQAKKLGESFKQISKLQEKVLDAKDLKAKQAALANLNREQKQFAQQFGPAAAGMSNLAAAWSRWEQATRKPTLSFLGRGMNVLASALPKLRPLFDTGAQAANRFLSAIQGWVRGGGMDRTVALLNSLARRTLPYFQIALSNVARTVGALGPMFAAFAVPAARAMARMTGAMAGWATGGGAGSMFTKFMSFVVANGPSLMTTLATLASAFVNILRAVTPLAPVTLTIATVLARLIAATPPSVITAIAAGFIAWSVGVKLLNAAFLTNPIGLALTAIAIAIALVIKYHQQIWAFALRVWHGILVAVQVVWNWIKANWPLLLAILTGPIGAAVLIIVRYWGRISGAAATAVKTIRGWFAWLVDRILGIFGMIVHGAAWAFGWVPGLGGKLRAAAKAFDNFRDRVNNAIRGVQGRTVTVKVAVGVPGAVDPRAYRARASGGIITGGSGPTADDVPVWASRGEYVVKAAAVRKYGTHMMDAINAGRYAAGGLIPRASTPSVKQINALVQGAILRAAQKAAEALVRASGGGYGGYGVAPNGPVQAYARRLLSARGWGGQWAAFNALVMSESGWRWNATNPTSGAYGIPQALPPGKMASAGADWRTNPYTQLRWMMGYIAQRYGSPAAAWAWKQSHNWYQRGAWDVPATGPAMIHRGEMILPERLAEAVREALGSRPNRPPVNVGPVYVSEPADVDLLARRLAFALDIP